MGQKISECRLIIRTGEHGLDDDVSVHINNFRLVARSLCGGTDSGEVMLANLFVGQEIQDMTLSHNGVRPWSIDWIEVFAVFSDQHAYRLKFRPEAPLAPGEQLSIWKEPDDLPQQSPAQQAFDV